MNRESTSSAMRLEPRQIAVFERDGFVVLPGFFSGEEIAPLREACHADPSIGGRLLAVADSAGNAQEIIEWTTFSDDYLGMLPRLARLIDGSEALLGKPVYHWHSKLSMKAPHSAGRWDWHQDYPYWYDEGCLSPDMLTCMIAVDRVTRANGCVNLIAGSHRYGRIDHVPIGASSGCDPQRLEHIQRKSPPCPSRWSPAMRASFIAIPCTPPPATRPTFRARWFTAPTTQSTIRRSSRKGRSIIATGRSKNYPTRRSSSTDGRTSSRTILSTALAMSGPWIATGTKS